jgi:uncharacterized protein YggE
MTRSPLAAVLLGALAAVLLAGCSAPAVAAPGPVDRPVITTRGTGTASAAADIVTVTLGVQTLGATASRRWRRTTQSATAVQEVLRGAGVAAEDLRTAELTIYPSYSDDGRTITGYQVGNRVTAVLRDLAGRARSSTPRPGRRATPSASTGWCSASTTTPSAHAGPRRRRTQAIAQARELADAAGVGLSGHRVDHRGAGGGPAAPPLRVEAASGRAAGAGAPAAGRAGRRGVVEVVHALG